MSEFENSLKKKQLSGSLNGFIFGLFYNNIKLYDNIKISKANISRLIMLATFIRYEDNALINNKRKQISYMNKGDIQSNLNLSYSVFSNFYHEITDAGILYKENNIYYLNKDIFHKGSSDDIDNNYTKIYVKTTRQLYNSCTANQHKVISYLYELIPKTFYKNNILSHDNVEYFKPMSIYDICNYLNLSINKSNVWKTKKELSKFKITFKNQEYYVFKEVYIDIKYNNGNSRPQNVYIINPLLFNSIAEYDTLIFLTNTFKV